MPDDDTDDATESREAGWDQEARDKLPAEDFAGPHQSFPVKTQQDVYDAARLIGHADDPAAVKRRIKAIARRKGFQLPDSWQDDDDDASESREAWSEHRSVDPDEWLPGQRDRAAWGSDRPGWYAAAPDGEGTPTYLGPIDRPVRESTVQPATVRANIRREGRGYRIKDAQIMAAGPGNQLMGNTYEPEAIQALVREVQRQPKAFVDHSLPSEVRERGHRSLKDLAGVYDKRTVRYDPSTQACLADLIVRPTVYDEYVAPVLEAGDNLGISVDGIGHCPDQPRHVKGWKRFNSADLVPAGGARGFIVREANTPAEKQAERQFAMGLLDDVTAADVRESAPALFEEIGRQYATAQGLSQSSRGSDPPPDDGRLATLETRVREAEQRAEAADARVYELEAEQNRRAVADFVATLVRECGLTDEKQAHFVARRFAGATMGPEGTYPDQDSLESAVREAAEEFKAVLPSTQSGQIVGLGSGSGQSGKFTAPKTHDSAIVTAMDRLFGAPSVTFPSAPSSNGQPASSQSGG